MRYVRQNRKTVEPIKKLIRPALYTWTGNLAFKRYRVKRFGNLPLMLRDDDFLHFCAAIGWVEVNWALYENQLVHWCQVIFIKLRWRGANGKEHTMPKPYNAKVRFLRSGFSKIPALRKFCVEGIAILDRGEALAETRHNLTHGVITSVESKGGIFMLENRRTRPDGRHTVKNVEFNVRDFPTLADNLVVLGRDAIRLSSRIADEFL